MKLPPPTPKATQEFTIDRLRSERDRLRDEVVRLRGDVEHDYTPDLNPERIGKALRFVCKVCGKETSTPTHAYFDPCVRASE